MMFDGQRICGKLFCTICAIDCGYEGRTACPHCHDASTMKIRRSPRRGFNIQNTRGGDLSSSSSSSGGTDKDTFSGHTSVFAVDEIMRTTAISPVVLHFQSPSPDKKKSPVSEDKLAHDCPKPPTKSLEYLRAELLNCELLYTDEEIFFTQLQDVGESLISSQSRAKNGYWKSGNDDNSKQYRYLKMAADGMIDRMREHNQYFGNLPKYPLKTIYNWFLTVRDPLKATRREISEVTHPIHWKFVKEESNMDKIFF